MKGSDDKECSLEKSDESEDKGKDIPEKKKEGNEDEEENKPEDKIEKGNEENEDEEEDEATTEFFEAIKKIDVPRVSQILNSNICDVNKLDKYEMTALQHAAYRGSKEMCQLLIDHGADVNGGNHVYAYSALHFAALSGSAQVCQLLMQHGAKAHSQNSVGRTAAQMGAFVGHHECVSTINNFISRDEVDYYTMARGLDKSPKLGRAAATPLHNLIMQVNFHPVKVAMNIKKSGVLLEYIPEAINVLNLMSAKQMKKGYETNELAAFKLHILSCILSQLQKEAKHAKGKDPIDIFIRKMLKCREPGGIPENCETFLRGAVRSFPHHQSTIMQQLVANLTHTKPFEEPGAWGIICNVVNGHKGFRDNNPCATCNEEKGLKICSRCHFDAYCNQECQKVHWFIHKEYCKEKAEEYQKKLAEAAEKKASNETTE